jgi:PadR family transcriptional regulator PadR
MHNKLPKPEDPVDRELLKGSTPLLLLSLLCEGPMYGYQIIETVRQRTGGTYTLKEGALYPALHKLEATEFITSYWETQENGRERRYYSIQPAGQAFLSAKKKEWNQFVDMVQAFVGPRA